MTVAVIMSTYNGENYLREQLDSILDQVGVEVSLFVRDDGSSDGTHAVLREYAEKHGNVSVDFAENVGVGNSFMNALYTVPDTFDYYAFADQDDIWRENKLVAAAEMLKASGKALYASNQENVDKDGNSLGMRYSAESVIHLSPASIINRNVLAGCTMVFTRELFLKLTAKENRPSAELLRNRIHDVWVAAVGSVCGGIVYDDRSFIAYRQHGNNVVGAYDGGLKKRIRSQTHKLFHKESRNGRSKLAKALVERFESAVEFPLVAVCASGKKRKLWKNSRELRSYTGEGAMSFFLKVLFGMY